MKIYLNKNQHQLLLDLLDPEDSIRCRPVRCTKERKQLFETMFPKLKYSEALTSRAKSYFGKVSGNEKDILLFLLKL